MSAGKNKASGAPAQLGRRAVLRGMLAGSAIAVGLPIFEAMLNSHGTAYAAGGSLPKRFGSWFWGVGAVPSNWLPSKPGAGFTATKGLAPLAPVEPYLSLVSGTKWGGLPVVHFAGQAMMLTGQYLPSGVGSDQTTTAFGGPGGPSVDQIVANAWKGQTPINSVTVGVSTAFQGGCLSPKNNVCTPPTQASWLAGNTPNYVEFSHASLYHTLFGATSLSQQERLQRNSVLDSVLTDLKGLKARLGVADSARLDAHAQAIRDIETGLAANQAACGGMAAPADIPSDPRTKEPLQERNRLFADMIVLALSCDLTRVFTVQFTGRENDAVFWQVGATMGHHDLSHLGGGSVALADGVAMLGNIQAFTMGELSYLLQKLQSTTEGAGNLLDQCSINITSCIGNPISHSYNGDMLQMIAGRAGGALKGGVYVQAPQDFATAVPLTAIRAVGVDLPSFGSVSSVGTADHALEMVSTTGIAALSA